ncbi:hypothetical protein [Mycobacterium sp. 1423905.2]|uniref:hypothetical protein n=1 Tax=Mycobacterium sp. 1423905.2 TaxID=1856859 RepID=UPI0012E9A42E|nr:hypothetical protein [Mycobacterium sp. 1423905.2]
MSPPSIDDAELHRALEETNKIQRDRNGRRSPFPSDGVLTELWRRGYIDEKGEPIK